MKNRGTDEELPSGKRNIVPQMNTENTMDIPYEQRGRFKENANKKMTLIRRIRK